MHDGGLLGSKLLDFVLICTWHKFSCTSNYNLIIIKGPTNYFFPYTSTYKLNYMYWNCFFLPPLAVPLLIMTVTQG